MTEPMTPMLHVDGVGDVPADVVERFGLQRVPFQRRERSTADLLRLDGRVAVVTGGGGEGIGNAIAHRLAEQGATLAILDYDQSAASAAAEALKARWSIPALGFQADVGDRAAVNIAMDAIADKFSAIDIVVNNAGGSGGIGSNGSKRDRGGTQFADTSVHDIELTVRVNLMGVVWVTQAALRHMLPRSTGRIINISSEGGKIGRSGAAMYNSSKAAVIAFTRNLAHEVGPAGLSTVAVCPGIVATRRTVEFLKPGSPSLRGMSDTFGRTTIGRVAVADEVASMVAFLASDAGSYVHGTAVSVGGGMSD